MKKTVFDVVECSQGMQDRIIRSYEKITQATHHQRELVQMRAPDSVVRYAVKPRVVETKNE